MVVGLIRDRDSTCVSEPASEDCTAICSPSAYENLVQCLNCVFSNGGQANGITAESAVDKLSLVNGICANSTGFTSSVTTITATVTTT